MASSRYEVTISPLFREDFYAEVDWLLVNSTTRFVSSFLKDYDDAINRLADFPEWFSPIAGTHYRWFAIGKCVAIYKIIKKNRQVLILRLYNMAQDWRNEILNGGLES